MKSWKTHLPFCVMLKQHAHHSVMSLLQGDCQRSKSILQAKQCGQTCPSQIFWRILQCFKPPTMSSNASLYALPLTTLSSDNLMNHESIKITDSLYIIVVIWTGNPEKKLHIGHLPNNFLFKFSFFFSYVTWLPPFYLCSKALVGSTGKKEPHHFGMTLLCCHVQWSEASLQIQQFGF